MCGIAGIVGRFLAQEIKAALPLMLRAQSHRGPDDEGFIVVEIDDCMIGMGNRRLAVIDRSASGHQPMTNPDTGDVLIYNGEIYNCPELRIELSRMGVTFRSRSDTEVLLRAYERLGVKCLEHITGMFAFAVWDATRRRLVLARDHLGIKPLYYTVLPGKGLVFASEVRALLTSGLFQAAIDRRALAGYFAYGSVQEPLTIIHNTLALPPRSWMELDAYGHVMGQGEYWEIPAPESKNGCRSFTHLVEEGTALLGLAVQRQLVSDVPLAVFLSSGLDSTGVLGLARKVSTETVHAVTVSFPDDQRRDEGPIARETARRLGAVYYELPVSSSTALQWVQDGLASMDQPTMDGINTYLVSRAAQERNIAVALSGQGGDEVLGGYRSFRAVPLWFQWMKWCALLNPRWRAGLAWLCTGHLNSVIQKKAQDLAGTNGNMVDLYFQYRRLLSDDDMDRLGLNASELGLSASWHLPTVTGDRYLIPDDPIGTVARLETAFYLTNTLLRDSDVFGMANSLEIRVPYLEKNFVEWAFRLPGSVLLPKGMPPKFLLREMCAEFYSLAQLALPKRGFTPPFAGWLLGPLREITEESLRAVKQSGLVNPEGLDRLYAVFLRESRSAAWSRVWSFVALGFWLNKNASLLTGSTARA